MLGAASLLASVAVRGIGTGTRNLLRNHSTAPISCVSRNFTNQLFRKLRLSNTIKVPAQRTGTIAVSAPSSGVRNQKVVGWWLLGCGGMVFGAVILGGVTRLTESGLSMVSWRLLGEHRPRTQAEWEAEFQHYQQFPEFKLKNQGISLEEFKRIWWMEYLHRQWGRTIGAAFFLPAAFFWSRGYFTRAMKFRIVAFGALLGAQGLMGWYMVRSGLEAERFVGPESSEPRVSQYRLAAHLSLAFGLYTLFLWSALDRLLPAQPFPTASVSAATVRAARRFRMLAHTCKGLVFLTAISGAFVAGLDAGLTYNTFPKMANRWIPDDILAFSPALRNFTENPTTVQFDHRVLGTSTLLAISGLWLLSRRRALPPRAYKATSAVAAMAWMQVVLGITTLVMYVPLPVAATHQSGSLVLLSLAVWLTHELKLVSKLPK